MSFKNFNKIILALFLAVFAINVSFAGEITPMNHASNASVSIVWVAPNTVVNVSFAVTNDITSTGNISTVDLRTSSNPLKLNITNALCPLDWINPTVSDKTPASGDINFLNDTFTCNDAPSGTKFAPGLTSSINLTMNVLSIPPATTSKTQFVLVTWDDNGTDSNSNTTNLEIWIDAKGPAINIISATPSVGSAIGNGNVTFNISVVEGEVQVNQTSGALTLTGACASAIHNSLSLIGCSSDNKTCNYSFVMDAKTGLSNGSCGVFVSFADTFGNIGNTTGTYQVDNTGPVIILYSDSELHSGTSIQFNITDTPAGVSQAFWSNDSGVTKRPFTSSSGSIYSIDTTGWNETSYNISIWANDTLGNLGDKITNGTNTVTNVTITIDNTKPDVVITAPIAGRFGASIFVNVTATDKNTVESVAAIINGTNTMLNRTSGTDFWTGNITSPVLEDTYNLTINASDVAGNYNNTEKVTGLIIDHTLPTITVTSPTPSTIYKINPVSFDAYTNENASTCIASIDNANYTMTSSDSLIWSKSVSLVNGNHNVNIYCSDLAGNMQVSGTIPFTVTVPGGTTSGGSVSSLSFNITMPKANHKPTLSAPTVDNEAPNKGATINCISGTFSDADGDSKLGEQWKWFVNGVQVSGSSSSFDTNQANVGDKITCSQRATDGINYTDWMDSSNSATVQNSEKPTAGTAVGTTGNDNPTNPLTGAFIGSLLKDNIFLTIVAVVVMGGSIAVLTIRFIKRRGLKVKVE